MYNPIANSVEKLAVDYGIDDQIVKIAICLLSTFPLNSIMKRLPDNKPNLKCWYILVVSSFYIFGLLNTVGGFRSLFTSSMITYLLTRFYSHSRFMPWINFVAVMIHLELSHIFRSNVQSGSVITGAEMVLVMKITSFAWSYHDGQILSQTNNKKNDNVSSYKLNSYQTTKVIKQHPSFLKYMAYCFFYPSLLTGPSFDFIDFDSWLNVTIFQDLPDSFKAKNKLFPDTKNNKNSNGNSKREIPKSGRVALKKIAIALVWLVVYFKSLSVVPVSKMLEPSFVSDNSFMYRIFYLWGTGFSARTKYYAAWTIAEASCIVCGLGYNGFDSEMKKIKWNRVQNIDIRGMEFAQNTHVALESWNQNTNKWLKYFVYMRVAQLSKSGKPGVMATFITFLTSALWHGPSPGYYLTFITGACFQTCGKFSRKYFRPFFMDTTTGKGNKWKFLYDVSTYFITQLAFGYMVQPFLVLGFKNSLVIWKSVYFYVHIGVMVLMFAFMGPYKKSVTKFLVSKHPAQVEAHKEKIALEKDDGLLSDILKDKFKYEQEQKLKLRKNNDDADEMHDVFVNLGIPDLDQYDMKDMSQAYQEFVHDYEHWKKDKGLEIEESNIQKAFEKFKKEFAPTSSASPDSNSTRRKMSFSEFSAPLDDKKK